MGNATIPLQNLTMKNLLRCDGSFELPPQHEEQLGREKNYRTRIQKQDNYLLPLGIFATNLREVVSSSN